MLERSHFDSLSHDYCRTPSPIVMNFGIYLSICTWYKGRATYAYGFYIPFQNGGRFMVFFRSHEGRARSTLITEPLLNGMFIINYLHFINYSFRNNRVNLDCLLMDDSRTEQGHQTMIERSIDELSQDEKSTASYFIIRSYCVSTAPS